MFVYASKTIPHAEERPKGRVSKHAWPLCPTNSGLTGRECRCCFGGTRQSEETGENRSVRHLSGDFAPRLDYRRYGAGAKARRHPASVAPRQPGEHVDLEEGTISIVAPMMGVFNNLVVFDPNQKQNSLNDIVPDLADSWSWNDDGTELTFKLHHGVKWHDGKPFTAADVKCTWDLLQGKVQDKLRLNAREAWWINLDQVTADSDLQATFHLKRRQPSFIALLASGFTPVYPCHVSAVADAPASDRHRAVQICRVQAQPVDQGRAQPGLLEARPALSRRHRVDDHPQPLDRDPRLYRRAVRHDLPLRGHDPDAEGRAQPDAVGDLRDRAAQCRAQPADHPEAALRQSRSAPGDRDVDRSQGADRHPRRGPGRFQHRDAAGARKASGRCRRR